jgi:hypothetical protein
VPSYWIFGGQNVVQHYSDIEVRTLNEFPPFPRYKSRMALQSLLTFKFGQANEQYFYQFIDRSFQSIVEKASIEQFPIRLEGISTAMAIDRCIISLVYDPLPDSVIPTDMKSDLYITRDKKYIIFSPDRFTASTKLDIDKRVDNYATLISKFPNLNFYLFYQQRLPNSPYDPLNQYFPYADNGQALDYFEGKKPSELMMAKMLLSSFEEHKLEYYATDHHWNAVGIGIAYNKAYDLLSQNYKDISPRLNLDTIVTFSDIKFYGSLARESYYPIQPDKFQVFKLDLPPYKVYLHDKLFDNDDQAEYWAGKYSLKKFTDYYGSYYGKQHDILDFKFTTGATRNLLIIGTSYARPLVPMLGSHYNHTYYLDLRQTHDFSLSQFIKEHPVDDVLFFGDNPVTIIDGFWAINP